jgi:hypothetical protein
MARLNPQSYKNALNVTSSTHAEPTDEAALRLNQLLAGNTGSFLYASTTTTEIGLPRASYLNQEILTTWVNITSDPKIISSNPIGAQPDEEALQRQIWYLLGRQRLEDLTHRILKIQDSVSTDELAKVIEAIRDILASRDFTSFDNLLSSLNIKLLSTITIITLLRSSSPYRHRLESWRAFLGTARQVLTDRGLDSAKLLRGLAE